ncbi:MAG: SpoIIE family protein phosphatase [Cytophagales bacterium]|nr:SpoIIE family protein phosphatase [Bernardetiaceae bacterium]MDW8204425.1 SpoIIE family protein phosphatase [Cytophagales bacterium]
MTNHIFIALVIWLGITSSIYGQINERGMPFIRNFFPKEYKAGLANWAIVQDNRGILYFGNDYGILEYDGSYWKLIKTNGAVRSLAKDKQGRIYAGGTGHFGFLQVDSLGQMRYKQLQDLLPPDKRKFGEVWTVNCISEGVFFQTDEFIFILKQNKGQPYIQTVPANSFFTFGYAVRDQFYVQQSDQGLMKWVGSRLVPVKDTEAFSAALISQVLPWEEQELLICVQNMGLYVTQQGKVVKWNTEADELLRDFRSYNACWLKGDKTRRTLAIGMLGVGVLIIDQQGKLLTICNKRNGLADDFVLSFAEDGQNGLWMGMYNGIARMEYPSEFQLYTEQFQQHKGMVNAITKHQGRLYIATLSGLFRLAPRELTHAAATKRFYDAQFEAVPGYKLDCWALLSVEKDLLVGTFMGVKLLRDETIINIGNEDTPPNIFCFERSHVDPDRVFVGSAYSIRSIYRKNGNWIDEGKLEGLRDDIRHIKEDKDGNLWAASLNNGIYLIDFAKGSSYQFNMQPRIRHLTTADGLPSLIDNHLFLIQGQIRVATERGIYKYEGTKFVPDAAFDIPVNQQARKVLLPTPDSKGNIWLFSIYNGKTEIGFFQKNNNGYTYQLGSLARLDDLHAAQAIYTGDSTAIWLSDINSIYRYEPRANLSNQFSFQSLIRQVSIGQDSTIFYGNFASKEGLAIAEQLAAFSPDLSYEWNRIRFDFTATAYNAPHATQFRYKLEGLETQWSEWNNNRYREYVNLSEGHYVFRVQARDVFGNLSTESAYHFAIKAPWYRTVVAYVLYILLAILAIWLVGEWRLQAMAQEKARLSHLVNLRTQELSRANQELEATLARVRSQNELIQQKSAELAHANEQLFDLNNALSRTLAQVQQQNKEIEQQRDQIHIQKENIESSIRYARRIQDAILPDPEELLRFFSGYFILNRPRDIVSGDFYWLAEKHGKIMVAVVDCTGHGVPGAMMSMLAASFLNDIFAEQPYPDTALLLDEMHRRIREALQQEKGSNRDGMDMAVIVYDPSASTVQFSGAKNSLYLVHNGVLTEYKADRQSIGGFQKEHKRLFTSHLIDVQPGDVLYLFTDGYADQTGGESRNKLMLKNFRELCQQISALPIAQQENAFAEHLNSWMGKEEQVDDVLLMGLLI